MNSVHHLKERGEKMQFITIQLEEYDYQFYQNIAKATKQPVEMVLSKTLSKYAEVLVHHIIEEE